MAMFRKNDNWYIDYYINGRRKREKIGPSKTQALIVLQKRKVQVAEGKFLDIEKHPKIGFEEMAKLYIDTYSRPNKKSFWRDEISLRHLASFFRTKYLDEVTSLDVEKYKAQRLQKMSPATVNRELACLKHMFNKAIEWGKVKENPVSKVKLFREDNTRTRYLEKEEVKALLDGCAEHLRPIVITALNTGMRKSEILNLKRSDVDLINGKIYIRNSKSGKPRDVDINQWLADTLIEIPRHPRSPYLFCDKDGRKYKNVRRSFETAKRKAGIENLWFHDLRHNLASHLAMAGVGSETLQEILGHRDYRMTRRYIHLSPAHKKGALELFCRLMDTIWTPKVVRRKSCETSHRQNLNQLNISGHNAEVAQSVEHWTENPGVGSSILPLGTRPT